MADHKSEEWAGETGDRWLANIDRFEGMLSPLVTRMIEAYAPQPGERILEIGCGGGPLARALSPLVGPEGHVTGLDIGAQLIDHARRRAADMGLANLSFVAGDASRTTPEGAPFDRAVSSFGVMFFEDSLAAFRHLHTLVRPGGRLDMACWAAPDRNPWLGVIGSVIGKYVEAPPPDLEGPGPFRFHDTARTCAMLEQAGFHDASAEAVEIMQPVGGIGATPEEAVEFAMSAFDMAMNFPPGTEETRARAEAELCEVFGQYASEAGVMMPSCALFYSARA